MLKIKDGIQPCELGFVEKDFDHVCYGTVDGLKKILFTIYKGSPYIRYSKAAYVNEEQLRLIYKWTKQDLIEWEDL